MSSKLFRGRKSSCNNARKSEPRSVEDFATQHSKNVELANSYHNRQREKDREKRETEAAGREEERKAFASKVESAKVVSKLTAVTEQHSRQVMPTKRQGTPSAPVKPLPKLIWSSGEYGNVDSETFTDMAIASGRTHAFPVDSMFISNAFRDGVTVICENKCMFTSGTDPDPFYRSSGWKNIASQIVITDVSGGRSTVNAAPHLGVSRLGVGTYNAVISVKDDVLPSFVPAGSALRITRNDKGSDNNDYKYMTIKECVSEAKNTIFCSFNGVGPRVYSVAAYTGPRTSTGLRYGVCYAFEKADADLHKVLGRSSDWVHGERYGRACVDMMYRASRIGIFAADIKCGNVLCRKTGNPLEPETILTDCDGQFFQIRPDLDWRSLMLVNLAMLAAHVRNGAFGDASRGFASICYPVLHQLWKNRDSYECNWLFSTPAANVKFDILLSDNAFELQKMFAIMATSYLYGESVMKEDVSSARHSWKLLDSSRLSQFWSAPENRRMWPSFANSVPPLITQVCMFAWERVEK